MDAGFLPYLGKVNKRKQRQVNTRVLIILLPTIATLHNVWFTKHVSVNDGLISKNSSTIIRQKLIQKFLQ